MNAYYNRIARYHNRTTQRLFIRFLKEKRVFYLYFKYLEAYQRNRIIHKMRIDYPQDFVLHAFSWHETKEGDMFWYRVSSSWLNFLTNFNLT